MFEIQKSKLNPQYFYPTKITINYLLLTFNYLIMSTVTAIYNCAQSVLYSALEIVWALFTDDVDTFHTYKAAYTATTATDAMDAVDAAEALPEAAVNKAAAEEIGVDVKKLSEIVLTNYRKTKGYINTAFAPEYQHANYMQAGETHYRKASQHDWEEVKALGESMLTFISDAVKKPLLIANDNMPTTFITSVGTDNDNFVSKYNAYKAALRTSDATDAKLTANNACFATARNMLNDAAILFPDNPQYAWENVLTSIDPHEQGFTGSTKDSVSSLPLQVAIIAKMDGSPAISLTADAKGKFKQILASGTYTINVSLRGYQTQFITKEITVHNMSRLKFLIVPA